RETGVVDEDVETAEGGDGRLDERGARGWIVDVQRQGDLGLEAVGAARAAGDPCPGGCKRTGCGRTHPARPAADDRPFALERRHPTESTFEPLPRDYV